jgi:hypothetical protein
MGLRTFPDLGRSMPRTEVHLVDREKMAVGVDTIGSEFPDWKREDATGGPLGPPVAK